MKNVSLSVATVVVLLAAVVFYSRSDAQVPQPKINPQMQLLLVERVQVLKQLVAVLNSRIASSERSSSEQLSLAMDAQQRLQRAEAIY